MWSSRGALNSLNKLCVISNVFDLGKRDSRSSTRLSTTTSSICRLCHPTSSFAPVITTTTTRGRHLTMNMNWSRDHLHQISKHASTIRLCCALISFTRVTLIWNHSLCLHCCEYECCCCLFSVKSKKKKRLELFVHSESRRVWEDSGCG